MINVKVHSVLRCCLRYHLDGHMPYLIVSDRVYELGDCGSGIRSLCVSAANTDIPCVGDGVNASVSHVCGIRLLLARRH